MQSVQRDSKGGKENAPVTRFPAPGNRVRPSDSGAERKEAEPMTDFESRYLLHKKVPTGVLFLCSQFRGIRRAEKKTRR